jgi:hypothetical protein
VYFINENRVTKCPEIYIKFDNGHFLRAIIDSGSEVNIISEKAFEEINKGNQLIPILPVENIVLVTAIGRRSTKLKKQVLLEFMIGEDTFEGVFMVSSQLNNDAIIGCQLLKEYDITLHFGKNTISYIKEGLYRHKFGTRQRKQISTKC